MATGDLGNLTALLFHLLPKNAMSWVTGFVMRLRLPLPVATALCKGFAAAFRLKMHEAEQPISAYRTIEDLFTRKLKPGLRPLSGQVCSPADGYLARSGPATTGSGIQVKGLLFDLAELVYGLPPPPDRERAFAWSQTIYLAPHNYHRVHAPFKGRMTALRHIPGQLWPVNRMFVARIPKLFCRNERLTFDFDLEGGGRAHVVMVGALNVGRITTPFVPDLVTNNLERQFSPERLELPQTPPLDVAQGDELGTFLLGSTVVIVYDQEAAARFQLVQADDNRPILMGHSLIRP